MDPHSFIWVLFASVCIRSVQFLFLDGRLDGACTNFFFSFKMNGNRMEVYLLFFKLKSMVNRCKRMLHPFEWIRLFALHMLRPKKTQNIFYFLQRDPFKRMQTDANLCLSLHPFMCGFPFILNGTDGGL